jgi:mRNA N6-methyladenine demethylase
VIKRYLSDKLYIRDSNNQHKNKNWNYKIATQNTPLKKRESMVTSSTSTDSINNNNSCEIIMIQGKDRKANRKKKRKRKNDDADNIIEPDVTLTNCSKGGDTGTIPVMTTTTRTKTNPLLPSNAIVDKNSNYNAKQNSQPPEMSFRTASTLPRNIDPTKKQYITIHDGPTYHELLQNAYIGFSYVPASQVNMMIKMEPSLSLFDQHPHQNYVQSFKDNNFHIHYQSALQALNDYYQYDIIMPGGKHSSRTFVRRTLVGEPGMTYKYLGLRLFTHAWRSDDAATSSKKNSNAVSSLFHNVYMLNQAMIQMTEHQVHIYQERTGKVVPKHLYNYNLTLINYMEPCNTVISHNDTKTFSSRAHHQQLRDEEFYNMGKASVSWHADSSLQDNSCIGVYHTLLQKTEGELPTKTSNAKLSATKGYDRSDDECIGIEDNDWKIALRPNPTAATTTSNIGKKARFSGGKNNVSNNRTTTRSNKVEPLPIVVPTKSGDVYFLLDEFNHKFQHMVLAGSNQQCRISSTHRVAVTATDTYHYISKACSNALLSSKAEMKKSPNSINHWDTSILLRTQTVLNEVEFEWIAQYWIQGKQHDIQHVWWQKAIRALEDAWNALERMTYKIYTKIIASCRLNSETDSIVPSRELVQGLLLAFQTRQDLRLKWDHRRADKIYKRRISIQYQPIERPMFPSVINNNSSKNDPKQLPKDLTDAIQTLSDLLQKYPQKNVKQQANIKRCNGQI